MNEAHPENTVAVKAAAAIPASAKDASPSNTEHLTLNFPPILAFAKLPPPLNTANSKLASLAKRASSKSA
ncbi:hypothetical protein [Amycolatopsis circi]|uniref:hypothetical protein n=1 Tax=Amycolatopsis circi TaxID=871959 RepID=UPI0013BE9147|nr:hypothetical protein [Amycolatopsis circi]